MWKKRAILLKIQKALSTMALDGDEAASFLDEDSGGVPPPRGMADEQRAWNLRLGLLLLEAIPIEAINLIQEEQLEPEEWTGEYVLMKLWESGLTWMSKYGLKRELFGKLRR